MALPEQGRPADAVLADLEALREHDLDWSNGRCFSLAYSAGPEVTRLAKEANARFLSENALNTEVFPSLSRMQREVVGAVAELLHGGDDAAGFLTSGGTETILLAVLAARERARRERTVDRPNMVLPTTAHAAFEKAAHYFDVRSIRVPVGDDFRADADAMARAIDADTVLVVASAISYPQGVLDPVPAIGGLATEAGCNCHVDSAMGGMVLPFLEQLGHRLEAWDFRVPGVTSVGVDLHKFGYTAKGASVIVHRDKRLRRDQTFVTDNWLGGLYGSSGMQGTKSGGPIAAAWAVFQHLGLEGYRRLTADARAATERLIGGVRALPGARVLGEPVATNVAITFDDVDPFAVADRLRALDWYLDRQEPPRSLHATVNAVHGPVIDDFLADLAVALTQVREAAGATGELRAYGTIE